MKQRPQKHWSPMGACSRGHLAWLWAWVLRGAWMVEGPKAVYFQKELLMKPRATAHQPEADVLRAVSPQTTSCSSWQSQSVERKSF